MLTSHWPCLAHSAHAGGRGEAVPGWRAMRTSHCPCLAHSVHAWAKSLPLPLHPHLALGAGGGGGGKGGPGRKSTHSGHSQCSSLMPQWPYLEQHGFCESGSHVAGVLSSSPTKTVPSDDVPHLTSSVLHGVLASSSPVSPPRDGRSSGRPSPTAVSLAAYSTSLDCDRGSKVIKLASAAAGTEARSSLDFEREQRAAAKMSPGTSTSQKSAGAARNQHLREHILLQLLQAGKDGEPEERRSDKRPFKNGILYAAQRE